MDSVLLNCADRVIANLDQQNSRFYGKQVLITGAAGFLGCHFVHYFLRLNQKLENQKKISVVAVDNFIRGVPDWLKALESYAELKIVTADITKPYEVGSPNFIIHAASIASPTYYRKFPIETMDANVTGLRLLLDHSVENPKLESFLYFSTSEIYGDPFPEFIPTPETYRGNVSCTGPRACYDESKRYGETLCVAFWQTKKVPVKIARPFNNYGPGLKITDKRVLPDFFRDVLNNRNITLLSDGKATRTFCFISDAITGYLLILLSNENGESFNIGVENPEITMRELAQKVIDICGNKNLSVEFKVSDDVNYLVDNPNRRCPDISKARKLLKYSPSVGLDEGLSLTQQYYLSHLNDVEG